MKQHKRLKRKIYSNKYIKRNMKECKIKKEAINFNKKISDKFGRNSFEYEIYSVPMEYMMTIAFPLSRRIIKNKTLKRPKTNMEYNH